jgi:signal transduction histidine kinase/DNA-binding NarL/FixJ family response regulator
VSIAPIHVLLIEDNPGDARLLRALLQETGSSQFELVHAERFSDALTRLSERRFDVVLLDLSLPDAQGIETISRLGGQADGTPIVILTGPNDEQIPIRALQQGAQDYLVKGQVDGQLLARALRYSIERHKAEESLKARNRELMVLRKISEAILASLDLNSVLEHILEQAIFIGSFDLGNIRLLESNGDTLQVVVVRGYRDPENVASHRAISRTSGTAQSSHFKDQIFQQPCVEEAVQSCDGLRTFKKEGVQSFVQVPVRADGAVLGIIQLATRTPRKFKNEEVSLWETIGNHVGVAVQRAQLYEETKRQARELEKASKLQADFSAMIAHDLRSPLMNITGVTEVMLDGMFGPVTEEQKKWLLRVQANSHNLIDLVSDFLDLSKLESGYVNVSKQVVSVTDLVRKSIESFQVVAQNKKVTVAEAIDASLPSILADPQRLEQVLSNLISNAIKFTGDGGEVKVGADFAKTRSIRVWVQDSGEGIPSEEIGELFQKYRQGGNASNSNHKGTGLGLVICKMIVEAHGGTIWAESEQGHGSIFSFSLPIDA